MIRLMVVMMRQLLVAHLLCVVIVIIPIEGYATQVQQCATFTRIKDMSSELA